MTDESEKVQDRSFSGTRALPGRWSGHSGRRNRTDTHPLSVVSFCIECGGRLETLSGVVISHPWFGLRGFFFGVVRGSRFASCGTPTLRLLLALTFWVSDPKKWSFSCSPGRESSQTHVEVAGLFCRPGQKNRRTGVVAWAGSTIPVPSLHLKCETEEGHTRLGGYTTYFRLESM